MMSPGVTWKCLGIHILGVFGCADVKSSEVSKLQCPKALDMMWAYPKSTMCCLTVGPHVTILYDDNNTMWTPEKLKGLGIRHSEEIMDDEGGISISPKS
jgi:hypothetical protein